MSFSIGDALGTGEDSEFAISSLLGGFGKTEGVDSELASAESGASAQSADATLANIAKIKTAIDASEKTILADEMYPGEGSFDHGMWDNGDNMVAIKMAG